MSDMDELAGYLRDLSDRARITERAERMTAFRADFKTVWKWYRHAGYLSQDEYEREYAESGQQVRTWLSDPNKLAPVIEAYRTKAAEIERDYARSVRIKAEIAAERESITP
jgi:hypothetical protein